jgi:hypothetical protein
MTLTKAQIVEIITEQNGFAKNKSIEIVESLISIIKHSLERSRISEKAIMSHFLSYKNN